MENSRIIGVPTVKTIIRVVIFATVANPMLIVTAIDDPIVAMKVHPMTGMPILKALPAKINLVVGAVTLLGLLSNPPIVELLLVY